MHMFFIVLAAVATFFGLQYLFFEWQNRRQVRRAEFYRYAPDDVFPIGWMITAVVVGTVAIMLVFLYSH